MESSEPGSEAALVANGDESGRVARGARRYLELLRGALIDQHYLDNELRINYLLECIAAGTPVDRKKLANPARYMGTMLARLEQERQAGELPANGSRSLAYAGLGRVRLDHLEACLEAIRSEAIEGDMVECGTGRGGAAIFMRGFLEAHELPERRVWVADRFDGRGLEGAGSPVLTFAVDLKSVRDAFARFDLLDDRVVFLQGPPSRTLTESPIGQVALLRVDSQDAGEVRAVLEAMYDRIAAGGFVVVDDYGDADCQAAVDAFRSEHGVADPLERIDWSAAAWRKSAERRRSARGTFVAAPEPAATKDLGVVVVMYNMRREAARTLHTLSRSYQRGIDDLDYEVIVVENGSGPEQRLGEEFVRSFGPEFRYIDLGDDATPSPAQAVNRGIAASTGGALAVMIDGAHLLTPGVLRYAMLSLSIYSPAIVVAKQWYVGPGQQPETVAGGYGTEIEDRLFAQIRWPSDGYRLFEIGHFIGDRDWFDGEWESNCFFVPRSLVDQAGGMDESFSTPGGGFVNLDFFERMVASPGVSLVTMLGEASFHQVHGGTTTNNPDPGELIKSYEDQYAELRGRPFHVPYHRTYYVGSIPPAAYRMKPRRVDTFRHFRDAHVGERGERPSGPLPVPQDLKMDFIDAFWRSEESRRATWLGKATHRPPTDLFVYQELIWRVRPDWIVETRTGVGGRALFLASVCELIGEGQVLSIHGYPLGDLPEHPRITYLHGDPAAERTAADARAIMGDRPRALVILGGAAGPEVVGAFRRYAPLVPVGSYVVVEDTILGGNPVWPAFGPGPASAVREILHQSDFVPDPSVERFGLTFNVGGFLKRVR